MAAVAVNKEVATLHVLSQVAAAGVPWCATGVVAAQRLGVTDGHDIDSAAIAIRVRDPKKVLHYIEGYSVRNEKNQGSQSRMVWLLPFDGLTEVGCTHTDEGAWWADPIQVAIDCYGGGQISYAVGDALNAMWSQP